MLQRTKRWVMAVVAAGSFVGGAGATPDQLERLMDDMVEGYYAANPLWVGPELGRFDRNDELGDVSVAGAEAFRESQRGWLKRARAIDPGTLDERERLDLDLVMYAIERDLALGAIHPEQMPVSGQAGPQYWLPQLGSFVPLSKESHYADYVERLRQVPRVLEQTQGAIRAGIEAGRVQPRVVIERAAEQAGVHGESSLRESPEDSSFYAPFRNRDQEGPLAREARRVIAEGIVPAYAAFAAFLEDEYLPAGRESVGISDGVDGVRAYELSIRDHTTLDMTADEVHELGLSEVARIRREMLGVIHETGFADGRVDESDDALFAAFVRDLRENPKFYFDDADEMLDAYRAIAKKVDPELAGLFGRLPRLPYGVRPIPRFAARHSPGAYYYGGSPAEGRPGYFMVNTFGLDQRPTYNMVALTLHESVPGHHLQISLAQEIEDQHPLRKLVAFTAFTEGWALYAERLGLEMGGRPLAAGGRGLYEDPYANFGRLNYEMWRACRLVVDSGMHAKGWSRQRAIDFMLANTANSELETTSEVDRYIGWPGQALAYKIGELEIREIRARAEETLGDAFDLRAFHDALLDEGALPLPVLGRKMDRWMEGQRASSGAVED